MPKMNEICVKVFSGDSPFSWGSNLNEVVNFFQDKRKEIPVQYRSTAKIDIVPRQEYDSYSTHIEIYYDRAKTKEERRVDAEKQRRLKDEERRRDLNLLKTLKTKYPEESK
jgi:hypothetical protein